jgi:hypothetical protein
MDAGSILRYDRIPVLQSILAYGAETRVPNHDICRLSYYVKCCVVGCGIDMPLLDHELLDYMTAHTLPLHRQELIKHFAYRELCLEKLINSAFILDEQHVLLPRGTLNTFFEFKTASTYFTVHSFAIGSGRQVYVHKVMLCTLKWLREYYINPFFRAQEVHSLLAPLRIAGSGQQDLQSMINVLIILTLNLPRLPSQGPTEERRAISERFYDGRQYVIPGLNLAEHSSNSPRLQENRDSAEGDAVVLADIPMAIAVPLDEESADSQMLVEATAVILL